MCGGSEMVSNPGDLSWFSMLWMVVQAALESLLWTTGKRHNIERTLDDYKNDNEYKLFKLAQAVLMLNNFVVDFCCLQCKV